MIWQDMLWGAVNACGRWWDLTLAVIAAITAFSIFMRAIIGNHKVDALFIARTTVGVGLVLVTAIVLNSGWLKPALGLLVIGIGFTQLIIVTDWCNRADQTTSMLGVSARWLGRQLSRAVHGTPLTKEVTRD